MSSDPSRLTRRDVSGYDRLDGTYHLHHDWTGSPPLIHTLLTAVAAVTGDEPHELDPLTDVVDPDALGDLFEPAWAGATRTDVRVVFRYNGCDVAIYSDGHLVIRPPGE